MGFPIGVGNDGKRGHRHPERTRRIPSGRQPRWESFLCQETIVPISMGFFGSPTASLRMTKKKITLTSRRHPERTRRILSGQQPMWESFLCQETIVPVSMGFPIGVGNDVVFTAALGMPKGFFGRVPLPQNDDLHPSDGGKGVGLI